MALIDSQLEAPVAHCHHCGGELYEWEPVYRVPLTPNSDGEVLICEECLPDFAKNFFAQDRVILHPLS